LLRVRRRGRIDDIEFDEFFEQFRGRRNMALRGLGLVTELGKTLDRVEGLLVAEARAEGARWSEIGKQLGISRQAAFVRHRARVKQTDGDSPRPFC
jgi:hypothetical protein